MVIIFTLLLIFFLLFRYREGMVHSTSTAGNILQSLNASLPSMSASQLNKLMSFVGYSPGSTLSDSTVYNSSIDINHLKDFISLLTRAGLDTSLAVVVSNDKYFSAYLIANKNDTCGFTIDRINTFMEVVFPALNGTMKDVRRVRNNITNWVDYYSVNTPTNTYTVSQLYTDVNSDLSAYIPMSDSNILVTKPDENNIFPSQL